MKTLETQRLILRDWALSDLDDFSQLWTNPNLTIPQGDLPMQSKEDCLPLLHYLLSGKNNYALALKETGKVIGSVGLNEDADGNPKGRNLGYILNESYWNQGYMQEALRMIIANASELTTFLSAAFPVDSTNTKSQHILEKLGFQWKKKLGIGGASRIDGAPMGEMNYYTLDLQ